MYFRHGDPYTPRSIIQLLSGLNRKISERPNAPNFMDNKNPAFQPLHKLLDSVFRSLHSQGIGTSRKQAELVTFEEEEQLWEISILGNNNPESLLNAVFFLNGINLVLRGGEEHCGLKLSQFTFGEMQDPDDPSSTLSFFRYEEHGSKNRAGGSRQLNLENKCVTQFAKKDSPSRCHYSLLQQYFSKLPPEALQKDVFYCKPINFKSTVPSNRPWYTAIPIGHNTLQAKLKSLLSAAGLDTARKSNHSLRATGISRMYSSGVPEKVIMERSGHLSREGVQGYERTTIKQQQVVCDILTKKGENYACSLANGDPPNHFLRKKASFETRKPLMEVEPNGQEIGLQRASQAIKMEGCTVNITMHLK